MEELVNHGRFTTIVNEKIVKGRVRVDIIEGPEV